MGIRVRPCSSEQPVVVPRTAAGRAACVRQMHAGEVERIGRGIYQWSEHTPGPDHQMAVVSARYPKAVVVLGSALAFHRLTTDIPLSVSCAVPRHAHAPRGGDGLSVDPVRMDLDPADVQQTVIEGVQVRVQRPGAAVADAVRFPERVGRDILIEAFLCAARRPGMLAEIRAAAERRRIIHRVSDWLAMAAVRS